MLFGAASVEAKSLSLGEVLSERYPLSVPRYQRSYAWQSDAVSHFVQDIKEMLDSPAGETSHFFGGVVCIHHINNQKVRPTSYEVVDGQQRLATVMLALSCVVEAAITIETDYASTDKHSAQRAVILRDDTLDEYMNWVDSDVSAGTKETRTRLELSKSDNPVFQALIKLKTPPNLDRESHRLLANSRRLLKKMVDEYISKGATGGEKTDLLVRVRKAILNDAHVIHIVSKEKSQAYRLFSVLNHRGESLSDADLLRSRTLELIENFPGHQEETANVWDSLLTRPSGEVEEFFQALYPSVNGRRARGSLFESIEQAFLPEPRPNAILDPDSVVKIVQWFLGEMNTFSSISSGNWPYERTTTGQGNASAWQVDRLRRLVVTLKHKLSVPLLMAAARRLDERVFAELVHYLEIFAFRYKIICNGHADRAGRAYLGEIQRIGNHPSGEAYSLDPFRSKLRIMLDEHAPDDLFIQLSIENLRYSNSSQRANIREFLGTLEDYRNWWIKTGRNTHNARPKPDISKVVDISAITLEHIYPQKTTLSDRTDEMEPLKHTLGNLTFFSPSENSDAGNKSFQKKRDNYYRTSSIGITSDLSKFDTWEVNSLLARQQDLLKQAVRVFSI